MVQLVSVKVILGLQAAVGYPVSTHITYANTDGRASGESRRQVAQPQATATLHNPMNMYKLSDNYLSPFPTDRLLFILELMPTQLLLSTNYTGCVINGQLRTI